MQFLRRAAPLFLLGFAVPSVALTLGSPQGAVWIGRPLDLVVPLSLGDGEGGDALCVQAELIQGGTRVDDKRVTVSLEPGTRAGETRLHVRSTMAIEEPVVQLSVRAGCKMNSTRQFVLLADMPSEVAPMPAAPRAQPSVIAGAPAVASGTRRPPRISAEGGSATGASTSAPARRATAPRAAAAEPSERSATARARPAPPQRRSVAPKPASPAAAASPTDGASAPAVPRTAAPPSGGARLQLDSLDPAAARNPALAASAAAAPLSAGSDAAVAAALAAATAAANAEELQRANERMKALEATLAALREQSAQNQRLLLEMRSELAEARDSRYRNPLVYVLGLLLLLALLGIALLLRVVRKPSGSAWWGDAAAAKDDAVSLPPAARAVGGMPLTSASSPPQTGPFGTALIAADEDADEIPDTLPPLPEDVSTPARYVNTEELFDVQQQSDFFVSLGQHEQAIAVLSEHIADNPETSALAYLDLLRIFHSLDRRDDYARVGQEFERAFNASVPAFEHFSESGRGLEHYRGTLARIEAQWPRAGTLNLIEELVFRKPGVRGDESFDLAAYRELLLLYAVAKEVIDPDSAPPTPVTPLSFLDTHEAGLEPTTQPVALAAPGRATPFASPSDDHNAPDAPLPSLYGAIDETLSHDTIIAAHPSAGGAAPHAADDEPSTRTMPAAEAHPPARHDDNSLSFDNTSMETLETLRGELEDGDTRSSEPTTSSTPMPSLRLDLELFDPAIEAEIAPRPRRRR